MIGLLGSIHVGPIQFDRPVWLWLIPVLWVLSVWIGRKSLTDLGGASRWVSMGIRLLVILLCAGALAEPQWRKTSKDLAVTAILDASQSVPGDVQGKVSGWIEQAAKPAPKDDRLGIISAAKQAYVQSLPSRSTRTVEMGHLGPTDGTDLGAAVRLGMATVAEDAANRFLIVSDGNETVPGGLMTAVQAAKAAGIPIDVLVLSYSHKEEVIVENLIAPATSRQGENVSLKVVLNATRPTKGRLVLLLNGEPLDLDPASDGFGEVVELDQGPNVLSVPVTMQRPGPQQFEAVFEPLTVAGRAEGDTILENNRSMAVTFVGGEGRILLLAESEEDCGPLLGALNAAKMAVDVTPAEQCPASLTELNAYDAILLTNQSAYGFSEQQQEILRQYVHESGGGLVMIGGPNSFGAGGWIGSPLEDALPIRLDPPQKRQMPRGALVLVMHSIEMPDGVFYGKKTSEAAVNALSRLDLAGIVEFDGRQGAAWVHKLTEVGDGLSIKRSIQNLQFGDMPDFAPSMRLALDGLIKAEAGQKHIIMISDGDPSHPGDALLRKFVENRVSISTVGVYPHSGGDTARMADISRKTGGKHYHIDTTAGLAKLPQIFIKEAQTVKRSLIWEGPAFSPAVSGVSETIRSVGGVAPALTGYVVAADREGLSMVTMRGKENDPIMAQWQYGLGRVVTYTSDATTRWNAAWVAWPGFNAFWEQHVRWAMRPSGSANVRVTTENQGDTTLITIDALDTAGERMNFADFQGRVATPGGAGQDIDLKQVGPGRYQGRIRTDRAGSYVTSFKYRAPVLRSDGTETILEGSVQTAVSRPFADEYRSLQDNAGLLRQVAAMTGGRVLSGDAKSADLWSREGITMPVATTPIWLLVAMMAVAIFLADVGIRRVRVEPAAIWGAVVRAASLGKVKTGQQMDSLRAAREQARQKMDKRAGEAEAGMQEAVKAAAALKFEASKDELRRPTSPIAEGGAETAVVEKQQPGAPIKPGTPQQQGEGMSRLMKAKQRAQEEMREE